MKKTRFIALALVATLTVNVVPAFAKQKYKTVKENGKEYIIFGSYEQDGNTKNGKEPLEWEVLGKDGNGILVATRYIIDYQPYNNENADVTWKTCTLRKWLNQKFYKTAFNEKEQAKIKTTKIENADNPYSGIDGGKSTNDKVFCLSLDEILKYYTMSTFDESRISGYCQDLIITPTQYVQNQGFYPYPISEESFKNIYKDFGYTKDCIGREGETWWLRSIGRDSGLACIIATKVNDPGLRLMALEVR